MAPHLSFLYGIIFFRCVAFEYYSRCGDGLSALRCSTLHTFQRWMLKESADLHQINREKSAGVEEAWGVVNSASLLMDSIKYDFQLRGWSIDPSLWTTSLNRDSTGTQSQPFPNAHKSGTLLTKIRARCHQPTNERVNTRRANSSISSKGNISCWLST